MKLVRVSTIWERPKLVLHFEPVELGPNLGCFLPKMPAVARENTVLRLCTRTVPPDRVASINMASTNAITNVERVQLLCNLLCYANPCVLACRWHQCIQGQVFLLETPLR